MAFLISIIGNTGVGKTSLAQALSNETGWELIPEKFEDRPFQARAAKGEREAILPNQVDYLLYRAEQEKVLRQMKGIFIQDGGLDLDFHLFTKLFYRRGILSEDAFLLCERLYHYFRSSLPTPNLMIYLTAPVEIIKQRKVSRERELDVSKVEDIVVGQELLTSWLGIGEDNTIMTIDVGSAPIDYHSQVALIKQTAISRIVNQ